MADITTSPPIDSSTLDHPANADITASLKRADTCKTEGNGHFRSRRWDEAIAAYQSGLSHLPKRITKDNPVRSDEGLSIDEDTFPEEGKSPNEVEPVPASTEVETSEPSPTELEKFAKARAVLHANIGACYVKLGDHAKAVESCSQALLDDPQYVKALQRRAAANEAVNTWTSLTAAQEDYNLLLKVLPQSSPPARDAQGSLRLLKPRIEVAQKQETAEMMDKLKGLGNSILGNFGLSTDNFKMEPNGQGGYSMNFSR